MCERMVACATFCCDSRIALADTFYRECLCCLCVTDRTNIEEGDEFHLPSIRLLLYHLNPFPEMPEMVIVIKGGLSRVPGFGLHSMNKRFDNSAIPTNLTHCC